MPSVEVGGLRLHFSEWGPGAARAGVVLVHGLGSSRHIWDFTAPILAEQGLRVLALDQRGHGESDQPDSGYDFESIAADLLGFLDAVELTVRSLLVGHSWGASVVLNFAARQPLRAAGIALVDGGASSPGERWSWEEAESRLRPPDLDGIEWTELLARMTRNNGTVPTSRAELIGRSVFDIGADGRVTRRFRIPNHMQIVRSLWEQRPADLLARIKCPILFLPARQSGTASEMTSAKAAAIDRAQTIQPAARVHWFEETVHDVPLQRPEDLASELIAFAHQTLTSRTAL